MTIAHLVALGMTIGEARVALPVLEGKSNLEVAMELHLSEKTVKFHLTKIFRKFDVKSRSYFIVKFLNQRPVVALPEVVQPLSHGKSNDKDWQ